MAAPTQSLLIIYPSKFTMEREKSRPFLHVINPAHCSRKPTGETNLHIMKGRMNAATKSMYPSNKCLVTLSAILSLQAMVSSGDDVQCWGPPCYVSNDSSAVHGLRIQLRGDRSLGNNWRPGERLAR
ncbi:hypothetical protein GDO81_022984 [Engystomops pustulosus]|uniref:Uncharacterized protein n=1 Tax=Engystomops pustulosus TaxID=76066 RepID=A0AAV6Z9X4_ENGPU|nr:hypothetical protein GDO81_022984 [Engystomops pustulosus]